jgi:aminopeptidase N
VIGGADAYLPGHGDLSYDVEHYDLTLDYKVETNYLSGHASLRCLSTRVTDRLSLDLYGLRVTKVTVNGVQPRKYQHRAGRLVIQPNATLAADQAFTVTVAYHGHPTTVPGSDGAGWEELTDGVIVAAQPDGAPTWFPCNDRTSNKASYRFEISTPAAYTAVANGSLVGKRTGSSRTVWVYEQVEPMSTYLATVQIGRYRTTTLEGSALPITVHAPARLKASVDLALARQGEMMQTFTSMFGPYPFATYTVVVTDDVLEIPLESQTLSTFGANHMRTDWQSQRLIAHELAHQWFGNGLTVGEWRDIWLHEGFACYSEWLWSEKSGGRPAQRHADEHWRRLSAQPQDLILADPSRAKMFDDRVYKRGALLLHALRLRLGDALFFDVLRTWVDAHRYGTVSTEAFTEHVSAAAEAAGVTVRQVLQAWLFSPQLPAQPSATPGA